MLHPDDTRSFLAACRGRPLQVIVLDDEGHQVFSKQVVSPSILVGRNSRCEITLDDPTVSSRHLYLQRLGNRVLIFDLGSGDLGSRAGVLGFTGRVMVDEIAPQERVQVGRFWLGFHCDPADRVADHVARHLPVTLRRRHAIAKIQVSRTDIATKKPVVHDFCYEVALIGRSPICKIKLLHDSVSHVHASLVSTPEGLWIVDFLSRNGVIVNGKPVSIAKLTPSDACDIGNCRITLLEMLTAPVDDDDELESSAGSSHRVGENSSAPENLRTPDASRPAQPNRALTRPVLKPANDSLSTIAPIESVDIARAIREAGLSSNGVFSDQLVLSLVQQFAQMQHQLFAQTQQVLEGVIKNYEEMNQQNRIAIEELRQEIASSRQTKSLPGPAAPEPTDSAPEPSETAPDPSTRKPRPAAKPSPLRNDAKADTQNQRNSNGDLPAKNGVIQRVAAANKKPLTSNQEKVATEMEANSEQDAPGAELHEWLTSRIASLNEQPRTLSNLYGLLRPRDFDEAR